MLLVHSKLCIWALRIRSSAPRVPLIWRRRSLSLGFTLCALALLFILSHHNGRPGSLQDDSAQRSSWSQPLKSYLPLAHHSKHDRLKQPNVGLIIKTGASTARSRLPAHFENELANNSYKAVGIYSDADESISGWTVRNVLADMAQSENVARMPKFQTYIEQRAELQETGRASTGSSKWHLDAFKFVVQDIDAVQRFKDIDWWVHADCDTYLLQSNLLPYLARLDPTEHHFLGLTEVIDDVPFPQGGSGYVLSNALMQFVFSEHANASAAFAETLYEPDCCGDLILAKVIYNTPGVTLRSPAPWSHELFNKQPPHKTKFHENNLCAPVMSFHHLSHEVGEVHKFERQYAAWRHRLQRNSDDFITYRDAFEFFAPNFLREAVSRGETRLFVPGWNNYAFSKDVGTMMSAWDCEQRCVNETDCLEWKWRAYDGKCALDTSMRIGKQVGRTDVVSGWRIDRWRNILNQQTC